MSLRRLLEPASVAIVGASAEPRKISGMLLDFLRRSGFAGRIYPINPRYEQIHGMRCYPSVDALPEVVDLVVVVVPVSVAFDALEAAARRGVPFCLLMTGGFGEGRSGQAGNERLARLHALCHETGLRIVGPNTVGMVNFRHRMPLTFADWYGRDTGQRGGVAIVTHSGSVGGLIFSALQINRIGVDYWIGTGNEATLETADFISHFSDDLDVHTIICFMEGVVSGRRFMIAADKARRAGKTVVVLKSGSTPESVRATLSHTTKNPTAEDVFGSVFRQLGVVQVFSLAELTYVMKLLTALGRSAGHRVGILSASGGACSLIADHVARAGLDLPELPEALQQRLAGAIPEYGSTNNPVDVSADVVSRREILDETLQAIAGDDSIDTWMVFGRPVIDRYHAALGAFAKASGKAVIVSAGIPLASDVEEGLRQSGVAVLDDPDLCTRALGRVAHARSVPAARRDWGVLDGRRSGAPADRTDEALAVLQRRGLTAASEDATPGFLPGLLVAVEQDRDFGPILTLRSARASGVAPRRVVRALPVLAEELDAAIRELAGLEGGLPAGAEAIGRAAQAIVDAYSGEERWAELSVELVAVVDGLHVGGTRLVRATGTGHVTPGAHPAGA